MPKPAPPVEATTFSDLVAPLVTALTFPSPTPDNTPVPGGGSWRWDIALPGWVENTPATPDTTQE